METFSKSFIINNIILKASFLDNKLKSLSFKFVKSINNSLNNLQKPTIFNNTKIRNKYEETKLTNRLVKKLYCYFNGKIVSFNDIKLYLDDKTHFEIKVLNELRNLKYGEILSYKDLAKKIGYKNGFQAIGTVLKNNKLPIILPCHRVIKINGVIGNYNNGKKYKEYLINLEKDTLR